MSGDAHGRRCSTAALLCATLAALSAQQTVAAEPPLLVVEAWVSTAGPYGESWELGIRPDGVVRMQVLYMGSPSGNLMARLHLPEPALARIRAALDSERFFELPEKLAPKTSLLHMPFFKLDVWSGTRHRAVTLYDPKQIHADPSTQRFLEVWEAVYAGLPLRPTWGGAPTACSR